MDMATVTKYLERSVQNCSFSNRRRSLEHGIDMRYQSEEDHIPISDITLDLNSHISVPSHLEQCLDLKTGEIYYINQNNGLRVMVEDPRNSVINDNADDFSGESDVTVFSEEDSSSYYESEDSSSRENHIEEEEEEGQVLVVTGCKACFMYFMVPKLLKDCPKCASQLLHFD